MTAPFGVQIQRAFPAVRIVEAQFIVNAHVKGDPSLGPRGLRIRAAFGSGVFDVVVVR